MSIGKKSIARAANAAAKAEAVAEEVSVAENIAAEEKEPKAPQAEAQKKTPEKFKKVSIGDKMPAFLL